jgi:hypothetical protein
MKHMKAIYAVPVLMLLATLFFGSCKKDTAEGTPIITRVRTIVADSTITSAKRADMVAIVGENLSGTQHVYFNGTDAPFNPAYVTKTTVLVSIPADAPFFQQADELKLVTDKGEVKVRFKIIAPPPVITGASPMHVKPGDNITVTGDNMGSATPGNVRIGNEVAQIVSQTNNQLVIKAPANATHGTVNIDLNGQTSSSPNMVFVYRQEMFTDDLWQNPANPATWGYWGGGGWGGTYAITTDKFRNGSKGVKAFYDFDWGTLQYGTWGDQLQPVVAGLKFAKLSVFVDEPMGNTVNMVLTLKNQAGVEKNKQYSVATGKWVDVVLPMSDFDNPTKVQEILLKQGTGGGVRKVYYDDLYFL